VKRLLRKVQGSRDPSGAHGETRSGLRVRRLQSRYECHLFGQIRTIIQTFKEKLPEIFPKRNEVPKTLIFARSDAMRRHCPVVRDEFGKGNDFAVRSHRLLVMLLSFCRLPQYLQPRVAVTVDMIATGTDVPAVECLLFMRIVKSRNYFEQMKGRGSASSAKTTSRPHA